jgi:RNA polymerase sigma-70 factor (ECF subfamily)
MRASDAELFDRWSRGDSTAGDELAQRHYWSVHRFFELRATSAAQDLAQRTFLACTEARHRYQRAGSFKAFLFGIARRQLLLHLRAAAVREESTFLYETPSVPSASGLVAIREEHRVLLMALCALPLHLQMTVQLHYWEGLHAHEIGIALGVSTSAVTTRLARARQLLREQIGKHPRAATGNALLRDLDAWARSLAGGPLPMPT